MTSDHKHFQGKSAVAHVAEAQARGLIVAAESHGTEIPGSLAAATDAARETSMILLLLGLFSTMLTFNIYQTLLFFSLFLFGWLLWKAGRSAWLGWARLERLHRILEQERWEIEHNREQEREELKALYAAKGFSGPLLDEVMDVLMADQDRLLKVMVQEELGLSLEVYEHPLQQSLGAAIGVVLAGLAGMFGYALYPPYGLYLAALLVIGTSSILAAHAEGNRITPALVWNLSIVLLAVLTTKFLLAYVLMQEV